MTPGGMVVGVSVLLTATVTRFHSPGRRRLDDDDEDDDDPEKTSTSNGR